MTDDTAPSPEDVAEAMRHDAWGPFVAWAKSAPVVDARNLRTSRDPAGFVDEWWPWWECFLAGVRHGADSSVGL